MNLKKLFYDKHNLTESQIEVTSKTVIFLDFWLTNLGEKTILKKNVRQFILLFIKLKI